MQLACSDGLTGGTVNWRFGQSGQISLVSDRSFPGRSPDPASRCQQVLETYRTPAGP
jgi:hypothetical protein